MSLHLRCDSQNHNIVQFTIQSQWDIDMYQVITEALLQLQYDADCPVNVILKVEVADTDSLGLALATEIDMMLHRLTDKLDTIVVVGAEDVIRELAFALSHKGGTLHSRVFITPRLRRAHQIIRENAPPASVSASVA